MTLSIFRKEDSKYHFIHGFISRNVNCIFWKLFFVSGEARPDRRCSAVLSYSKTRNSLVITRGAVFSNRNILVQYAYEVRLNDSSVQCYDCFEMKQATCMSCFQFLFLYILVFSKQLKKAMPLEEMFSFKLCSSSRRAGILKDTIENTLAGTSPWLHSAYTTDLFSIYLKISAPVPLNMYTSKGEKRDPHAYDPAFFYVLPNLSTGFTFWTVPSADPFRTQSTGSTISLEIQDHSTWKGEKKGHLLGTFFVGQKTFLYLNCKKVNKIRLRHNAGTSFSVPLWL